MTLRVAINGFGRIGHNVMRVSRGADTGIEIVGMNSTSGQRPTHLLTYDSILGSLIHVQIETTDDTMIVNGKEIRSSLIAIPSTAPGRSGALIQ